MPLRVAVLVGNWYGCPYRIYWYRAGARRLDRRRVRRGGPAAAPGYRDPAREGGEARGGTTGRMAHAVHCHWRRTAARGSGERRAASGAPVGPHRASASPSPIRGRQWRVGGSGAPVPVGYVRNAQHSGQRCLTDVTQPRSTQRTYSVGVLHPRRPCRLTILNHCRRRAF